MNPLDRMQIFARVAELSSFTQAAQVLGLPKASASLAVQQLEAHLGTRLLHRTTRRVQLTQDGQAFYERCKDLLDDVDELQAMFQQPDGTALRGRVRIDMSTGIARQLVLPALPDLLARHPLLEVELSSTDRRVDLVREGFDCVIRVGPVAEPGLVARPLGLVRVASCASPGYLARKGTPQSLADLAQHDLVHYVSTLGTKSAGFETTGDDGSPQFHPMAGRVTVNSAEAYLGACAAGLGLIQAPLLGVRELIDRRLLVEVLPHHPAPPMPVTLIYPHRRHLPQRVRVVMDWLAAVAQAHLQSEAHGAPAAA
ncbi:MULTISPECIES: LysR family transcriptional regulator [Acidovorax]|uniref:LysR family transcriptional regulator n=1 Tax=Acidovorax facilis TaxID=12917 RepID=A0ABV8DIF6_9BURK|nr:MULTISPECIES: LysR family transcriptional regulator [Acidovorax]KQB60603.1 transcriptional regulator [Acidovorax sp. SD340]MBO1009933.1 LysR family transcriptional regulator [Acidovorax sp. SD340]MCO4243808.1 LysR family transcriptional regulator [Acidovorax facilis]